MDRLQRNKNDMVIGPRTLCPGDAAVDEGSETGETFEEPLFEDDSSFDMSVPDPTDAGVFERRFFQLEEATYKLVREATASLHTGQTQG